MPFGNFLVQDDPTNAGSSMEGGLPPTTRTKRGTTPKQPDHRRSPAWGWHHLHPVFRQVEAPLSPHPSALALGSALQHLLPAADECDTMQTQKHLLRRCLARRLYECRYSLVRPGGHLADRPNERGGGRTGRRLQSRGRHVGTGRSWGRHGREEGGRKEGDTIKLGTYETTGGDGGMWMVPVSDSAEREGCCKELPSQAQQPRRLRTEDQENIKQRQQQAVGLVGCWAD